MLAEAIRRTFEDRTAIWRVPLLTVVSATGIGMIFTLGYGFAIQNHVADGGDEYPDVDLDVVWYGLKYILALFVFATPAYLIVGGVAVPALLGVASDGLTGANTWAAGWEEAGPQMMLFSGLFSAWVALALVAVPASMGAFLEDDGRLLSALSPARLLRFAKHSRAAYAQLVAMLLGVSTVATLLFLGVQAAAPQGSTLPTMLILFVLMPLAIAVYLCMHAGLGLIRQEAAENDPLARFGWEHLQDQRAEAAAPAEESAEGPDEQPDEEGQDAAESSEVEDPEPA